MLHSGSLRSKIARRIFAVFLICALLPFAGLAFIAYHQVVEFFETKNQDQLRDLAKLFGMDVHEKLTLLHSSMQIVASKFESTGKLPDATSLQNMAGGHTDRWINSFFLEEKYGERNRSGDRHGLPDFNAAEKKQLAAGKAVISVIPAHGQLPARLFLSMLVDPPHQTSDILTGEVDISYLWGFKGSRLLLAHIEPCVFNRQGVSLMCSDEQTSNLVQKLNLDFTQKTVGSFEWSEKGLNHLVSYWTVPMKYEFQTSGWVILLKTTKEGAFASVKDLQKTFVLGIVVAVGLSILIAIYQIRKRLVPVERLQAGTRRIAANDFSFRVQIQSNDEFDELAASLNSMADQLGRQFNTLTTTGEIDRAVLSLRDTSKIVETILSRISAALHCDTGSLTIFSADDGPVCQWRLDWKQGMEPSLGNQLPRVERQQGDVSPGDVSRYQVTDEVWPAEATKDRSPVAYAVREAKSMIAAVDPVLFHAADENTSTPKGSCLGAPLFVKDEVLGVLSLYTRDGRRFSNDDIDFVKQLSNQAAVAIYNSQLYERTLNQAAELLKANKAKDEFLSVMSHELRTPLNIIMGYLRVLQDKMLGDLTNDQTQALGTIEKQSNELLGLINSVMEATLLQTGEVTIDPQPVSPTDIFKTLKSRIALPPEKALKVTWRCDSNLPTLVSDSAKLERILQIFIDNGIKFTEEGSVTITADYAAKQSATVFTVTDTGIGIPEESREKIFEVFRQVDNSRTREHGGLGLGLFIAKRFAHLIGAEIAVESQVGKGSMFTLTVPLGTDVSAGARVPIAVTAIG